MDAENSGKFELGPETPVQIQPLKTTLKNSIITLQSLSQPAVQLVSNISKPESENHLVKSVINDKKKMSSENTKLNAQLNKNYSKIHDLQKSIQTSKSEIESLLALTTQLSIQKLDTQETIKTLKIEVEKYEKRNEELCQSLHQIQPQFLSQSIDSLKQQKVKLTQSINQLLTEKGGMEKSLTQQKVENQSLEIILQQSFDLRDLPKNQIPVDYCVICQENEKSVAFVPCGHFCICEKCSMGIVICPICRSKCSGKYKIYQ